MDVFDPSGLPPPPALDPISRSPKGNGRTSRLRLFGAPIRISGISAVGISTSSDGSRTVLQKKIEAVTA